jgi:hypothetical protein
MNVFSLFALVVLIMWPVATFGNWVARPSDPFDETAAMGLFGASLAGFGSIITYIVMSLKLKKERNIIPPPRDDFL